MYDKKQTVDRLSMKAVQSSSRPANRMLHRKGLGKARNDGVPFVVALFIVGLLTPLFIYAGTLRLSVYRIVLLALFFPSLYLLVLGKAGRIKIADICVVLICIWSSLSLTVVHGFTEMIETIGIFWVETLGAYLIGRCFIRTPEAFYSTVRMFFFLGLLLIPFALFEMFTGRNYVLDFFDSLGATYADVPKEKRLGFERVQGPFAHQIHMGVFFGALIGLTYYVLGYQRRWLGRMGRSGAIAFLGFSSLSSGPLVGMMTQIYMLLWDGIMNRVRQRWYVFVGLAVAGFVTVDLISNRTPFHVIVEYLSFNKDTAYNRIHIWNFGTESIFANPVFGIGLSENWERPWWMSPSVDMFWIVGGMRHGVLVWGLYIFLFLIVFVAVAMKKNLSERVSWYRTGYLISMFGFFMAGWTVHFWDAIYAFFMFLFASGIWILDYQQSEVSEDAGNSNQAKTPVPHSGYTRFPTASVLSDTQSNAASTHEQ
ncbi:O-antigen ligase family protein [Marimonas arenosa]|uniref:O-antigen ligase n=1 Tax=Marimonas arenosa TaxID=1795305 RepID=A0AAE4B3Y3_9RHOB|nr:hypothetical protein [Marimonas arenosa]MDQ2089677.1 hypothetical protein [Marimonas arenosa]